MSEPLRIRNQYLDHLTYMDLAQKQRTEAMAKPYSTPEQDEYEAALERVQRLLEDTTHGRKHGMAGRATG